MAPAGQKATDPIQQLFVDKINEYSTKAAKAGKSSFFYLILIGNQKIGVDVKRAYGTYLNPSNKKWTCFFPRH